LQEIGTTITGYAIFVQGPTKDGFFGMQIIHAAYRGQFR
jgi:hypothetical protein